MRSLFFGGVACLMSGSVWAADPSFDCAKAGSSAEVAICGSEDLAALDREMARLYQLAVRDGTLSADRLAELKAFQRGWIKGRDDCWKADQGLEACVATEYGARIAEIRTGYAASRGKKGPSDGPYPYVCDGLDLPLSVVFVNAGTARAVLSSREGTQVLTAGPTGSGVRYEGRDVVFHTKGRDAHLKVGKISMSCRQDDIG
ncbi:MliC family protein [Shimia abyssi]|uniref:Membrane-bound lysozyme inhibitor of c-type lysozyme MliC n=1 Tax=Shimia abyssi TaxID=1662395 RepID=A0A2P8FHS9_9RHOB|nr:MliC family protein [Shimia abyssi]PSL21271.1 uncharacterized protein CLV88_102391 [Shimia abyssi]